MADKETMAKILSGEPLPTQPPVDDPELSKFHRDLINYLRRIAGKFTTQNMPDPGSATGTFDEWGGFYALYDPSSVYSGGPSGFLAALLAEYCHYRCSITTMHHIRVAGSNDWKLQVWVDDVEISGSGDNTIGATQGVYTFDSNVIEVGQKVELTFDHLSSTAGEKVSVAIGRKRL